MLTSGSRRLERADKLTRRLADTHKRRVVYLYTAVHDDSKAVLFSVGGGLFVDHAGLQPQYLGAGGHGVFGHRHDLPATPEHVDYVHRRGDMLYRLVRLFAKYRTTEIRVDGVDLEPEALQCAGDRVAGAGGPVGKSDDSYGARTLQKVSYLSKVRVCAHVTLFLRDLRPRCYTFSTHIGFPAANAAEQRLPVSAVHRVCVRAGLLGGVLAGGCKALTGSIRRENHQTITVPGARIFSSRLLQELAGRH